MSDNNTLDLGNVLLTTIGGVLPLCKADGGTHHVYVLPFGRDINADVLSISSSSPLEVNVVSMIAGYTGIVGYADLTAVDWRAIARNLCERPGNAEVRNLFHRCWTHAVVSPDYIKQEWRDLSAVMLRLGYRV